MRVFLCKIVIGDIFADVSTAAIELEDISKRFGKTAAVRSITARIPEGIICGVIGPNGSGKTTTLRIILDILEPDAGEVRVFGGSGRRLANDRISYLPEERGLYRKMKISHQLAYFARLKNLPEDRIRASMRKWLDRLDLGHVIDQKVETLSKGMAQKIQFIGAIINEPRLLILDEPFSGLDPVNLEILRGIILELKRNGTTILFSTHDMSTAEKMCDSILMIYNGEKVLDGSMEAIQEQFGDDTIRLRFRRSPAALTPPEVIRSIAPDSLVRDLGRYQEVRGIDDPDLFLGRLTQRVSLDYFEIAPPNLHDIFVRIAQPTEGEARETRGAPVL